MEVINDDIQSNKSIDVIRQFKARIIDTAKNIRSNDQTFSISTLPQCSDRLTKAMNDYVDSLHRIESSHNAFLALSKDLDITDETNLDAFEEAFKANLDADIEHNAHNALNEIIALPEIVVEVPSQRQCPKDPITRLDIQEPVRNKKCKHTYDKSSIEQYIASKKQKAPCPVAGCRNKDVVLGDLEPDEDFFRGVPETEIQ